MGRTAWLGGGHIGDAVRLRFRDDLASAQSVTSVVESSQVSRGETP